MEDCFVYINKYLVLDTVKVVNLQGKLKSSKRQASELHFDFSINNIGKVGTAILLNVPILSGKNYKKKCLILLIFFSVVLADSVLAFHKHGMQGRSFKNGDITQEICDRTRIFKLLGSDR